MKIKDLTPYTYRKIKGLENAIAIGWLEGEDLYQNSGEVDSEVVKLLKKYSVKNLCMGVHMCEYCKQDSKSISNGNGEIWVVKDGKLYIAPYLIIHYIKDHNYKPPEEFIDAVLNGFKPHSPGYEMMLNNFLKKDK